MGAGRGVEAVVLFCFIVYIFFWLLLCWLSPPPWPLPIVAGVSCYLDETQQLGTAPNIHFLPNILFVCLFGFFFLLALFATRARTGSPVRRGCHLCPPVFEGRGAPSPRPLPLHTCGAYEGPRDGRRWWGGGVVSRGFFCIVRSCFPQHCASHAAAMPALQVNEHTRKLFSFYRHGVLGCSCFFFGAVCGVFFGRGV